MPDQCMGGFEDGKLQGIDWLLNLLQKGLQLFAQFVVATAVLVEKCRSSLWGQFQTPVEYSV